MAYTTPPSAKSSGSPVLASDYNNYRTNIIDHETRISAAEASSGTEVLIDLDLKNLVQYAGANLDGILHFQAKKNYTLTSAIITELVGSTSGTHEFDIKIASSVGGTYSTVFSTLPSISSATPAESTNAIFNTTAVSISIGDWIRLDITSLAVGAKSINISLSASPN